MKKMTVRWVCAAVLAAAALLAGCQKSGVEQTAYEKIQQTLSSMTSYEAEATVTYIANKNRHTYETKQQARATGEYRIEVTGPERVAGNITINDNKVITQFNTNAEGQVSVCPTESAERSELFVTSFVKNYIKSQEMTISVANMGDSVCTVLEAAIPGSHPYLRTEKLWVDNKTYKPVKLVIYDPEGVERITVTFEKFEYNVTFDDDIFKVK